MRLLAYSPTKNHTVLTHTAFNPKNTKSKANVLKTTDTSLFFNKSGLNRENIKATTAVEVSQPTSKRPRKRT